MKLRTAVYMLLVGSICFLFQDRAPACELLGFSFSENVPARRLFSAFRCRGSRNSDGWGVAFYPDRSAALFKEATNATESNLAEFLTTYKHLEGKLLIAHVRKASVGGRAHQNTHPFLRELGGRDFVLAHNGTLKDFRTRLKLSRIKPLGINDSEFLLCYLLGRIDEKGIVEWGDSSFKWLRGELRRTNDTGSLNCLFSDGTHLFAYHDKNGSNSLYYLERKAPYSRVRFPDLPKEIDLSAIYPEPAVGIIVATKPLTDESWTRLVPGQLLVVKDGVRIFPETLSEAKP